MFSANNQSIKVMLTKNKSLKQKIKKKSAELLAASTSHGLPNVFRTQRLFMKVFWLGLFIISTVSGVYTVFETVQSYLKYEVVTKIDVITEVPSYFPAITLINLRNRKANNSLDEIMMYCTFNLIDCSEDDFDTITDESGYVSYRFKSFKSYTPGMQYGLQILVNIDGIKCDRCYLDGIRLIVHNHSVDPGYYSGGTKAGFTLAPGLSHEIAIKRTFSSKLGLPYNDCIKNVTSLESFDSELYRFMLTKTNYSYRQIDCFDFCMGRELNKNFNITNKIDHWLKLYKKYSFDTFWKFYSKFIRGDINNVCRPLCPLECDSIKYEVSNSFTKLSGEDFKVLFDIDANISSIIWANIYYENLEYTSISQVAHMDMIDLISNIGSNLSLFIGISFISFAEIIEILIEILCIILENQKKKVPPIKTQAYKRKRNSL